ncbi:MAG: TlpA family protein disulfide reductase [Thermonemataceae bacterium]
MKSLLFILSLLLTSAVQAQEAIQVIKFNELESLLAQKQEKVIVANFWASWCAPCVKELPAFEQLHQHQKDVEVVLISLDFVEDMAKAQKILQKKGITAKVVLLDETDYDTWIDQVEPSWQGAIPATLLVSNQTDKRIFLNEAVSYETLLKQLQQLK